MTRFLAISSSLAGVKKTALASIFAIFWLSFIAPPLLTAASAAGTCPASGIVSASGAINLTANCQVAGNITLSGTASLTMTGAVLTVNGNIVLNGQAQLNVTNGGLTFPQTYFSQYSVSLNNSSLLRLTNSTFVTTGNSNNHLTMVVTAYNTSVVDFQFSTLSTAGSWLLGNFHDQSRLFVNGSQDLPTEIYPFDSSQVRVTLNSSVSGLWLDFLSGSSATINVPRHDRYGNFTFNFGNSPGFNYSVLISASSARLGLNSHPNSSMTVNGNGTASTNDVDLVFGYYVENSTGPVSINGLDVGSNVTRQFTDQGRTLSLNNVNLNPISWQVYVSRSNGFPVTISNSKLNELGALYKGLVNISNSTLQISTSGAFGGPGSIMNITGTQIWSQAILAKNSAQVNITYSGIHGNYIEAVGAGSSISMSNVVEYRNGSLSLPCTPDPATGYTPNINGVPLCNPLNPLGQCSQVSTSGGGVVTGTTACN